MAGSESYETPTRHTTGTRRALTVVPAYILHVKPNLRSFQTQEY